MDKNYLENRMQNELPEHEVFIDTDQLWSSIQKKEKKKNRTLYPFFFFGLLLLTGLGILLFFENAGPQNLKDSKTNANFGVESINKVENEKQTHYKKQTQTLTSAQTETQNQTKANKSTKLNLYKKKEIDFAPFAKKEKHDKLEHQEEKLYQKSYSINEISKSNAVKLNTDKKTIHEQSSKLPFEIESKENKVGSKFDTAKVTDDQNTDAPKPVTTNPVGEKEDEAIVTAKSEFDGEPFVLKNELEETKSLAKVKKTKNFKLQLSPFVQYGNPNKSFEYDGVDEKSIVEKRNLAENPLEQISFGFLAALKHSAGFSFGSGIEFTRLQEEMIYLEELQSMVLYPDQLSGIVNQSDGTIQELKEDIMVPRTTINEYYVYNTYTRWDLPLILSYEKRWNKLSLKGDLKYLININQKFDGYLLNEKIDFLLVEKNPTILKTKVGTDLFVSFGLGYHFKKFCLRLSPFAQLDKTQVLTNDNKLKQFYRSYGLRLNTEF